VFPDGSWHSRAANVHVAQDGSPYPRHPSASPYRMLFPFILIVIVVLLLVWRLIVFPGFAPVKYSKCPEGSTRVVVAAGDTCWRIAEAHGCGLEDLRKANANLVCERLIPGDQICVPVVGERITE
jgi:LysM domain